VECKSIYVVKIEIVNIDHSKEILKELDPGLIRLLDGFEIDDLIPEKNYFKSLIRSIIYQQLSGSSAKAIHDRFISIYDNDAYPMPKQVLRTTIGNPTLYWSIKVKAKYVHN
jgi:3-methyladenine DNA glycosylase/8-oxoguanine DNA glycosylase